jgi:uncharacterized protein YqhQ
VEGVMMRSPEKFAVAVRRPDGGIALMCKPFVSLTRRVKPLGLPIVRGAIVLIETLAIGMQALSYSAEQAGEEEQGKSQSLGAKLAMAGSMVIAFGLGLLLFFYLPLVASGWIVRGDHGFAFNLVDGVLRLVVFFGYILAIGRWKEMRRVFEYHGAEHMAIHTLEAGEELTPDNVATHDPRHPRCGTNFLFLVMAVSIVVFVFLGKPDTLAERLIRLAFVPVVGGVAYEILRLSGKWADKSWAQPLLWPGLSLQYITTKYPSRDQMEVAIHSLKAVLD